MALMLFIFALIIPFSFCQYVDRIRGISLIKEPLYDQTDKQNFQCLDGSMTIPFDWVNDDYCDCKDGSDEPGTSACPNGKYHCVNLGHSPYDIPSSRVNDMICDCCDGSDEWMGYTKCSNHCEEAGRAAREEANRLNVVQREGYQKKLELVKQGKNTKDENQKKVEELKAEKESISKQLEELDMVKQVAEKSEREAKDAHAQKWKAEQEAKDKIKQKEKASEAFEALDLNKDKRLSYAEIAGRIEFDKNQDGKVAEEEYTEYFGDKKEVELEHFVDEIWSKIKDVYKPPVSLQDKPPSPDTEEKPVSVEPAPTLDDISDKKTDPLDGKLDDTDEEETEEDEVEDFETTPTPQSYLTLPPRSARSVEHSRPESSEPDEKMPDYDDSVKKLIADADQARKEYDEVNEKVRRIENEMRQLEDFSRTDFGPEDEFAHLHRQCFEFSDTQYTYGLCVFEKTYQKPKGSSHGEVGLGTWDSWSGSDDNKYSKQSYKHGLTCWNGPARTTEVKFTCGKENRLISASEPSRCEYAMEFETPAACKDPLHKTADGHSEL